MMLMLKQSLQAKLAALLFAGLIFCDVHAQESGGASVQAVYQEKLSPYQLIEATTGEILAKIELHRAALESSTEAAEKERKTDCFFNDVDEVLSRIVDFDWIAFNVMGPYRNTASAEQKERFARTFHSGLVETYGRGLLSYSSEKIVFLPADTDIGEKRKVTVRQEIRGVDANYPLEYSMGLGKDGQWRVINVVINGINLGKTFRTQFVQSSKKYDGDLDQVIANWDSGVNNG